MTGRTINESGVDEFRLSGKREPVSQDIHAAADRLRTVDSYGLEWANMLQDKDTDPQMIKDCVIVVREYLRIQESHKVSEGL